MTHPFYSRSAPGSVGSLDSSDGALIAGAKALALTFMVIALWGTMHIYKGITGDAELYAVQALARIQPGLAHDLYLQNVSQDYFTIFSTLYSACIRWWGLQNAALLLTLICTAWFLVAAWALARELSTSSAAFLAVAALIIIRGIYGSYGVFSYSENWITARSLAEALTVTAIACHFIGHRRFGFLVAASAMFVHPIMALPGLLLLVSLQVPLRVGAFAMGLGILLALGMALAASMHPRLTGPLAVMDADWLEVVHERSQFLFLQYWTPADWEVNSRPFLYLTFYAVAIDGAIRKLSLAALMVGASGLVVAAIAGLIGPVAILVQGQAWRWVWIATFTSILLLAPSALVVWRDEKCGPICAMLLILGWTFVVMNDDACVTLALLLWLTRSRVSKTSARYLRWAAAALGIVVAAWAVGNSWGIAQSPSPESGRDLVAVARIRNIFGLGVSAALIVWMLFYYVKTTRSVVALSFLSTILAAGTTLALHGSLRQSYRDGAESEINEFSDWRTQIPPTGTVYVVPAHDSATFAWFTLQRLSYLTVNQSAGVVFSRATAIEVKRRSKVLLPLLDPDWQLLTRNTHAVSGKKSELPPVRPLTRESLVSVCNDSALDFVVAKETLAVEAIRHTHVGNRKDWNLYDCRRVRSLNPAA